MTKERRDDWQIYSALLMLVSGVVLSFLGFFIPPVGQISDSVLWYFSQTLIYAGSVFGFRVFIRTKISELKDELKQKKNE